jgi:hypothetical protein
MNTQLEGVLRSEDQTAVEGVGEGIKNGSWTGAVASSGNFAEGGQY